MLLCSTRFAAWLTVLPVLLLVASTAAAQGLTPGLTPAERETFAAVSQAGETVARAGDRTALILATTQLSNAADEALTTLDAADGARETAAAAYRAAARAAQASMVTCANGYACTDNRLDPFEGIGSALAEHLQRIAAVSFANAAYAEVVGVAGAAEARERGGRVRQLAARMGGVEAAEATDRWNALLGDIREEVAVDNALYDRAAAAAATARRNLFDDVHQVVEAVAAAATRTPPDVALRAVMGAAQNRLVELRARLSAVREPADARTGDDEAARTVDLDASAGSEERDRPPAAGRQVRPAGGATRDVAEAEPGSTEPPRADPFAALEQAFAEQRDAADPVEGAGDSPTDAQMLDATARDPFAALDRAFASEAAASAEDESAASGNENLAATRADPFAALERAFAEEAAEDRAEDNTEEPVAVHGTEDRAGAGSTVSLAQPLNRENDEAAAADEVVEPANLPEWVAAVNAGVTAAEQAADEAEAGASGTGSWFARTTAYLNARDRLAVALARVEALTVGNARPSFVTGTPAEQAYAELGERIEAADERGHAACESIEQPR